MDQETARASLDALTAAEQRATDQLSAREATRYFFVAALAALVNGVAVHFGMRGQLLWVVMSAIMLAYMLLEVWLRPTKLPPPGLKKAFTVRAVTNMFLAWILLTSLLTPFQDFNPGGIAPKGMDLMPLVFVLLPCLITARTEQSELIYLRCVLSQSVFIVFLAADPYALGFRHNAIAYSFAVGAVFLMHALVNLRAQRA
jgi:hypothetical protein